MFKLSNIEYTLISDQNLQKDIEKIAKIINIRKINDTLTEWIIYDTNSQWNNFRQRHSWEIVHYRINKITNANYNLGLIDIIKHMINSDNVIVESDGDYITYIPIINQSFLYVKPHKIPKMDINYYIGFGYIGKGPLTNFVFEQYVQNNNISDHKYRIIDDFIIYTLDDHHEYMEVKNDISSMIFNHHLYGHIFIEYPSEYTKKLAKDWNFKIINDNIYESHFSLTWFKRAEAELELGLIPEITYRPLIPRVSDELLNDAAAEAYQDLIEQYPVLENYTVVVRPILQLTIHVENITQLNEFKNILKNKIRIYSNLEK